MLNRSRRGFTLIELLVVIAIIAVLVGLLLPAVQKVRESAARAKCQNNLHNLAIALHAYHDTNNQLPPGAQGLMNPPSNSGTTTVVKGTSWLVLILPQVEQAPLYAQYNFGQDYSSANNLNVAIQRVPIYYCPSGSKDASGNTQTEVASNGVASNTTHYYGIMGPSGSSRYLQPNTNYPQGSQSGSLPDNSAYSLLGMLPYYDNTFPAQKGIVQLTDVLDGASNTLMVGEMSYTLPIGATPIYVSWTRGNNNGAGAAKNILYPINSQTPFNGTNFNDLNMGSNHTGGANFALGDGSVRFIKQNINMDTYKGLSTIAGREPEQVPE